MPYEVLTIHHVKPGRNVLLSFLCNPKMCDRGGTQLCCMEALAKGMWPALLSCPCRLHSAVHKAGCWYILVPVRECHQLVPVAMYVYQ
jgi:hypothetical protein